MLKQVVQTLINEHVVCVPPSVHKIPIGLFDAANESGERLIKYMAGLPCQTSFTRPWETSPDIGLIDTRNQPDKDLKFFLHVSFDFKQLIATVPELQKALHPYQTDIETMLSLHASLNGFTAQLLDEIRRSMPEVAGLDSIVSDFMRSCSRPVPSGNSVLRRLLYPEMPEQTGAAPHFDIDFVADHMGDFGGKLLAHPTLGEGKTQIVSPPPGYMTVFFGLKAFVASGGRLVPLFHSATTEPGQDRHALVQFNHTATIPSVKSGGGKKFNHLFKAVGIESPESWYARQW